MTIETARHASLEFVCVFGQDAFVTACLNKGSSVGLTFIVSDAGVFRSS